MKLVEKDGVKWLIFDHFVQYEQVIHGFSTRIGGVSDIPFATLNLAFHVGDDPGSVVENRRRFCQALGLDLADLTAGEQVHSDKIRVVIGQDRGCGAVDYDTAFSGTDGFVTDEPGVVLSSYYADCVPLYILDPEQQVVGLAHGGWKGTIMRIGARIIEKMVEQFQTKPEDCLIGIGPSIGPCCYEVDRHVITPLQQEFVNWFELVEEKENGRWNLDLWKTNYQVFLEAGVNPANIEVSGLCTSCNTELFFSHRAEDGKTGRMASIIALEPKKQQEIS